MSSAKKKPTLVTCPQCSAIFLSKDLSRHQDFCGKSIENSEIACIRNGSMIGFNVSVDKPEGFLPPDAVGWEKEHSILIHPQTMESLSLLARQPVRITSEHQVLIGVLWPCKELPLLKVCLLSNRLPKERMILLESVKFQKIDNLSCNLDSNLPLSPSLLGFLNSYFSHSYLQFDLPISLKYLGQELKITAKEPLESSLSSLSITEPKDKTTVISTTVDYKLQVMGQEIEQKPKKEPKTHLSGLGGCSAARQMLQDYVLTPISRSSAPCSVLLWGLPGSGKSTLLRELGACLQGSAVLISSCEELEQFDGALDGKVMILDLNEVEKENQKANRVLSKMLEHEKTCVILSVRSSDSLDLGYRVRFPVEVEITVPTQEERMDILSKITEKSSEFSENDLLSIARQTHGFTAGDLNSLLKASKFARGAGAMQKLEEARKRIRPTGIRQFILEVPNVSWNDIGGMEDLKIEIQQAVIWPQKHPEAFTRFGIDPPAGILLYGPPGCSKTLIARALANEARMNFLAVKGPELFSKWVGDSEKAIRDLFARARQVAPTIVFFDEIDAVGSSRGSEKSSGVSDRVLAQLLTELDGLEKSSRVILLAATNRPDQLDSALLRPGRLDRAIYVGLPCEATRRAIIEMRTRKMKIEPKLIEELVEKTSGYSGAELVAVCRTAAMFAMRENLQSESVQEKHFEMALSAVVSRTEAYLLEIYDDFKAGRTSNA